MVVGPCRDSGGWLWRGCSLLWPAGAGSLQVKAGGFASQEPSSPSQGTWLVPITVASELQGTSKMCCRAWSWMSSCMGLEGKRLPPSGAMLGAMLGAMPPAVPPPGSHAKPLSTLMCVR